MQTRLIFGRSPNALIATFAIVFNSAVILAKAFANVDVDGLAVGAVNAAFAAIVLYIAGNDTTQIQAGIASAARVVAKQEQAAAVLAPAVVAAVAASDPGVPVPEPPAGDVVDPNDV